MPGPAVHSCSVGSAKSFVGTSGARNITSFVFNTGETMVQRTFPLAALGIQGGKYLFDWTANRPSAGAVDVVAVTLAPHDGALLFTSPSPILSAPEQLP